MEFSCLLDSEYLVKNDFSSFLCICGAQQEEGRSQESAGILDVGTTTIDTWDPVFLVALLLSVHCRMLSTIS